MSKPVPPCFITFNLANEFGGPATADFVRDDNGYTVMQGDRIVREKMPLQTVLKAQGYYQEGNHRAAALILHPLF